MATQREKYHLAMSGEFFVAAQLQRLGVSASVTYGNAKSADVIAFRADSDRVVVVEVKTTRQPQWVVGGRVPDKSNKPWVFVYMPEDVDQPPSFYVLTQTELRKILEPIESQYFERYRARHGVEYGDRTGVVNIRRALIEKHKDKWDVILKQISSTKLT